MFLIHIHSHGLWLDWPTRGVFLFQIGYLLAVPDTAVTSQFSDRNNYEIEGLEFVVNILVLVTCITTFMLSWAGSDQEWAIVKAETPLSDTCYLWSTFSFNF